MTTTYDDDRDDGDEVPVYTVIDHWVVTDGRVLKMFYLDYAGMQESELARYIAGLKKRAALFGTDWRRRGNPDV